MSRTAGRHHRSHLERERSEARLQLARVARAHRRAEQVGASTPVDGTPAQRSGAPRPHVIDNAIARRDPLTRPLPAAPSLPGARRAPSAPLPVHRRRPEAAGVL
ncbi:hypothetical protein WCD74_14300 [Actinomycetospora sp. OC33-EN08]|uniref:Uncharacterized protein n=1 Tax=Actinomycetospora aurantiaca TaxID=3129233 RepID=A0ABU8MNP8_9PSEU